MSEDAGVLDPFYTAQNGSHRRDELARSQNFAACWVGSSLLNIHPESSISSMGLHFSRIWERMFGKKEMRILMVGLDAAGKVILYLLLSVPS